MSNPRRYLTLSHTADIGIEVEGGTLAELFENAAWGLLDTITDAGAVERREKTVVSVRAGNREELLVRWLSELLFLFDTERKIYSVAKARELTDSLLTCDLEGETFDPLRHTIRREIKAITYHGLSISEENGFFRGRVIFDL